MNEANTKRLIENHPELFAGAYIDGAYRFQGFECGDGWYNLIDKLCITIEDLVKGQNQVRETLIKYKKMRDDGVIEDIPSWFHNWDDLDNLSDWLAYPVVQQIKEKFGGLRFYAEGTNMTMEQLIRYAENLSTVTCESCGSQGEIRRAKWLKTLCISCHEFREAQHKS